MTSEDVDRSAQEHPRQCPDPQHRKGTHSEDPGPRRMRPRWWLIPLGTLIGLAAAWVYLQAVEPRYTSEARVLLEVPGPPDRYPRPLGAEISRNRLYTLAVLISSPEILISAMEDPNVQAMIAKRSRSAVEAVFATVLAAPEENSGLIRVTASSPHPQDAATVVNAVVLAYRRWLGEERQQCWTDRLRKMERQLKHCREKLRRKRQERLSLEARHPELLDDAQAATQIQTLKARRRDLIEARFARHAAEAYYNGLKRIGPDPNTVQANDRQFIAFQEYVCSRDPASAEDLDRKRIVQELTDLRRQLEAASYRTADPNDPNLLAMECRRQHLKEDLRDGVQAFVRTQLSQARRLVEEAEGREEQLQRLCDQETARLSSQAERESKHGLLQAECQMLERECRHLQEIMRRPNLHDSVRVHIVEWARPARTPTWPRPLPVLAVGSFAGLLLGSGFALLFRRNG